MAEKLTQYRAYTELLSLLKRHVPQEVIPEVSDKVAQIVDQALRTVGQAGPGQAIAQKQQAASTAAAPVRDLQSADAVLVGVSLIIPRGKFDVGFFSDAMQVSNKQTSAVIPYSSIQHVLVIDAIPKQPNTTNVVLVMKSGQAVQQGKNLLDIVVLQTKDQPELHLPAPAACQHLGDSLSGAAAVVLSQLLASFIEDIGEDTFLTADASVFSSSQGDLMISANRGATAGWLVPLSAGLCYVGKPGRFVPVSAISKVLFHRAGGGSSTFDITIKFAAAGAGAAAAAAAKPLELGQIDAAELPKLQGYLLTQRIRIGTDDDGDDEGEEQQPGAAAAAAAPAAAAAAAAAGGGDDSDDDEEDDDYNPEAADNDGNEPSSKRQRVAAGAAAALGSRAAAGDVGEDDDDSDDEEEAGDESDDDSSDVSLIDEDAMDEDDEDEDV